MRLEASCSLMRKVFLVFLKSCDSETFQTYGLTLGDYGLYQHGSHSFLLFWLLFLSVMETLCSQKCLLRSGNSALKCVSLLINRHRQGNGSN